jgi:hypothetical protein
MLWHKPAEFRLPSRTAHALPKSARLDKSRFFAEPAPHDLNVGQQTARLRWRRLQWTGYRSAIA